MRRRTESLLVIFAALAAGGAFLLGRVLVTPPKTTTVEQLRFPMIPLKSVTAELTDVQLGLGIASRGVPRFEVPIEYHNTLLRLFDSPEASDLPKNSSVIGSVCFLYENGDSVRVSLVWFGVVKLFFSIDGKGYTRGGPYCAQDGEDDYRDESLAVHGLIREIYKQNVQKAPSRVEHYLEILDKSSGRMR
ncbi:MAG: hypothetical protein L0Y71_06930 [Gemmataceae bacterium]|nr:hypothetical protein [Gemmataceae bacterium]